MTRWWAIGWVRMAAAGVLAAGCASNPQVTRMAVDEDSDLSGRWNDTDSRKVSKQMVSGLLSGGWLGEFASSKNRKPVVVVGTVLNLTSEHMETGLFTKDIERELVNGGRVRFVAGLREREEVRLERRDQQTNASEETAKRVAQELGADYMLKGGIKTQIDAVRGEQVKYYQVDLELVNVESNEKVWIGSEKIKKRVEQPRFKW